MASPRTEDQAATRKNLSKNLLQMKFMHRGKLSNHISGEEASNLKEKDDSHWIIPGVKQRGQKGPINYGSSYVECEDLLTIGRMSFLNFNPAVEKVHREVVARLRSKSSGEKEEFDGISDSEMAQRYETLVDTIAKKYGSKRKASQMDAVSDNESEDPVVQRPEKKFRAKFLKPKLD